MMRASKKKDEENKVGRNVDLQPTFVEAVVVVRVVVVVVVAFVVVAFVARDSPRSTPPLRLVPRVPPSPTAAPPSSSSSHPASASYSSESVFLRHPPGGILP